MSSTASNKKVIALVDCNAFFCSCERLFAPHLEGEPVVVLSNNDGCVVSRTNEAKALQIPMGVPLFKIKELVKKHRVAVFSSNYSLYGDLSARVMKTLSQFTPELEIYSIDEAFLNLKGFEDIGTYAVKIRDAVKQQVGIPTSIGIGPTKVLAKVANKIAKKSVLGVFDLTDLKIQDEVLEQFHVEDLWGIGSKSAEKLKRCGIVTAKQLRDSNDKFIDKILTIVGQRILLELRGESCLPIELFCKDQKEICCARGFGKPVQKFEELEEALATYVTRVAERLRKKKQLSSTLTVFLHTNPFKNDTHYFNTASMTLLEETNATNTIIRHATTILKKLYRTGYDYKRLGIILSGLVREESHQLGIFERSTFDQDQRRMKALDLINLKMGQDTLRFASVPQNPLWKMLSKMRSPSFTTDWNQILNVN